MTTPLPPYPGATKESSVNYTTGGEPFAIANAVEDDLDPRDLYYLARAVEDHTHGAGRGLPINRIATNIAPQVPGDLQVAVDDFKWWGSGSAQVFTAVNADRDQTVNGTKRLNQPLLLPRQASAPGAPGLGLAYLYLGPGDRLYLRSGNNAAAPVGTPSLLAAALAWQTTQGAAQAQVQQLNLYVPTWTLGFRPLSNDAATLSTVAPLTYGGTPVTLYVTWTAGTGVGKVNFTFLCGVSTVGGDLTAPATTVVSATVDAPNTNLRHQRTALTWSTGLPAAGDVVYYTLRRDDGNEGAAGSKFAGTVSVIDVAIVYG